MEKSVIFNDLEVQALNEGRKTQFRRVVTVPWGKSGRKKTLPFGPYYIDEDGKLLYQTEYGEYHEMEICPFGGSGDTLWVKESYALDDKGKRTTYMADKNAIGWLLRRGRIRPAQYMRREDSRYLLEITNRRCQRLQEITNEDAMQEGLPFAKPHRHGPEGMEWDGDNGTTIKDAYARLHNTGIGDCWMCMFREGWNISMSKNRKLLWDMNPWVWAITFKVIK